MTTTTTKPYPVKVHATRTFTCEHCGRETTRTRLFCRRVKAKQQFEVVAEVEAALRATLEGMAAAWQPTMHRWCEAKGARR